MGSVPLAEPEGSVLGYVHVGGLHHPLIDPANRIRAAFVRLESSATAPTVAHSVSKLSIFSLLEIKKLRPHLKLHEGLASSSPVAVDMQDDVRGADGDGHLVPLVVGQAVGKHLGVGLLASGAVVKTHLAALAAALQLKEPAEGSLFSFAGVV